MREFDGRRAAFWLVAAVIAVHCVVVLAGVAICVFYADELVAGRFKCDQHNRLTDLLMGALAAALAFSSNFNKDK